MQLNIYEVEYSCSPGGVDKWEVSKANGQFIQGDFDSAEQALTFVLSKFKGQRLSIQISSLEAYHKLSDATYTKPRLQAKTN